MHLGFYKYMVICDDDVRLRSTSWRKCLKIGKSLYSCCSEHVEIYKARLYGNNWYCVWRNGFSL